MLWMAVLVAQAAPLDVWLKSEPLSVDPQVIQELLQDADPEHDPAILGDHRRFIWGEDGTLTEELHRVYLVRSSDTAQSWGYVGGSYAPWHEDPVALNARIINADGTVVFLDSSTIVEQSATASSSTMYADNMTRSAPLPNMQPGTIVEEYVVWNRHPLLPGVPDNAWQMQSTEMNTPHRYVTLLAASRSDILMSVQGEPLEPTNIRRGDLRGYQYTFGPTSVDDIVEEGWPRGVHGVTTITANQATSWQAIAEAYQQRTEPILVNADVSELVATVTTATSDPAEQRQLAAQMVRDDIRYVALELGHNAIIPHSPEQIIANGYGDCKDKASVLIAVLRGLGHDSWLTLINAGYGLDANPEVPTLGQFNHAIVAIDDGNGGYTFVDPTDDTVPVTALPYVDQGRNVLVIKPGVTELVQTPISSATDNTWRTTYDLRLNEGGDPAVTETFAGRGRLVSSSRDIDPGPHDIRMRNYEEWAEELYEVELTLLELSSEGDSAKGPDWSETRVWETLPMGFSDGSEATVWFDFADDVVWPLPKAFLREDTDDWVLADRPFGVRVDPFDMQTTWDIEVPEGFVSMYTPRDEQQTFGSVSYSRTTEASDGHLVVTVSLSSDASTLSVDDSVALRDWAFSQVTSNAWQAQWTDSTQTLVEQGKTHDALSILAHRTAADRERMYSRASLTMLLSDTGFADAAMSTANSMLSDFPEEAVGQRMVSLISLADTYGRFNDKLWDREAILPGLDRAIELEPENDSSLKLRAAVLVTGDQTPDEMGESAARAIEDFKTLVSLGMAIEDAYVIRPLLYGKRYDIIRSYGAGREELAWRTAVAAATWAETGSVPGFDNPTTRLSIAAQFIAAQDFASARDVVKDLDADTLDAAGETVRQLQFDHTGIDTRRNPEDAVRAMLFAGARNEPLVEFFAGGYLDDYEEEDNEFRPDLFDNEVFPGESVLELMGCTAMDAEGNDELGYRIMGQSEGNENTFGFVVRERNRYKIAAGPKQVEVLGQYVMAHLDRGDEEAARTWLGWILDAKDAPRLGTSPLNTEPMVWMWRHGQTEHVEVIARMMRGTDDDMTALRDIIPTLDTNDRTALIRRVAQHYLTHGTQAEALEVIKELPDIMFREPQIARWATSMAEDVPSLRYIEDRVLANGPAHPDIASYMAKQLFLHGEQDQLDVWEQSIQQPNARNNDIMEYTWFIPTEDESRLGDALRMARLQASSRVLHENELHTLATLELASGNWQRATDAHVQAIGQLQAGESLSLSWGSIRSQLLASWGLFDAADEELKSLEELEAMDGIGESTRHWNAIARQAVADLRAASEP